jgi:hypothetical protein
MPPSAADRPPGAYGPAPPVGTRPPRRRLVYAAGGGWSRAPERCPWGLARSRTRSRRFRVGPVALASPAELDGLVTASLRGRPPEHRRVPGPATPVRSAGTPEALRSLACALDDPVPATQLRGRLVESPMETPSRTEPHRSPAFGPDWASRSPTSPRRARPLGFPTSRDNHGLPISHPMRSIRRWRPGRATVAGIPFAFALPGGGYAPVHDR